MKTSDILMPDGWRDVYKDPVTDPGKASKKGLLALTVTGTPVRSEPGGSVTRAMDGTTSCVWCGATENCW